MANWRFLRKADKDLADEMIIEGLKGEAKERQHFENHLFDQFIPFMHKAHKQYKISREDALSAYSDAIISLISQVREGKFRAESKLSSYLYKIYQYKCIDLIRKDTRQISTINGIEDIPHMGGQVRDILQKLITQEQIERLSHKMETLGKGCKELLLLWGEGYSLEEIAQRLNFKDSGSAKSRKYACLKKLKAQYQTESIPG